MLSPCTSALDAPSPMKQDLSSDEILQLLHHWRSDRYVINTASTVEVILFGN